MGGKKTININGMISEYLVVWPRRS
jgi:hypothetical protein